MLLRAASLLVFVYTFTFSASFAQVKDTFTDPRDGRVYESVKIGNQVWMAENLQYKTKKSWCYGDLKENCKTYGRLYMWEASLKACPPGWHLPSYNDWMTLINHLGGTEYCGGKMKAISKLWRNQSTTDNNQSGFSALPGGKIFNYNAYRNLGYYGYYWTATDYLEGAWFLTLSCSENLVLFSTYDSSAGFSVRCVKD
jgi:uncharacterized protein (TIGR02145 family)